MPTNKMFTFVVFIVQLHLAVSNTEKDKNGQKADDIPYIMTNCKHEADITFHDKCPNDDRLEHWCYHLDAIPGSIYPQDSFCLMEDPVQGVEPGVVSYQMSVRMHTGYTTAGIGVYFNYIDSQNYDMVYKIDFSSTTCIVGFVEDGQVHNETEYNCGRILSSDWVEFQLAVEEESAEVTLLQSVNVKQTFMPHHKFIAKSGPLILNAYNNDHLHPQDIHMTTDTCQDDPDNSLCDPCSFAYNVQSTPVYPLPDHRNFLLWYSRMLEMVYTSCFIKALVLKNTKELVKASSHVGSFSWGTDINTGDIYGERNQCTQDKVACFEVKSGGSVTDGVNHDEDNTEIRVTLGNKDNISHLTVNEKLKLIYGADILEETLESFRMLVRSRVYGKDFGIYCVSTKESPTIAQDIAFNMCLSGSNSYSSDPAAITENGWAIKFH